MLETFILKIDKNIGKDDFDRLLSYVSKEKKEQIIRFHRFEDAQRSLLGDIIARYSICKRLGIKNKNLIFNANKYGKPILVEPSGIHFNISHSGNWVVCAVDDSPVGIDVETIKPIDFKIAERFFSRDEYIALLNKPEEMRLKYFYIIWTLKESYIKAEGKGLSIPLNSFSINIDTSINVYTKSGKMEYGFIQFLLENTAIYAICNFSDYVSREYNWTVNQFIKEVECI